MAPVTLTPVQKIKQLVIDKAIEFGAVCLKDIDREAVPVDEVYDLLVENDEQWDAMSEIRSGTVETNVPCDYSRHYESKSVAAQTSDGDWVGWTYWYGGGKHGNPEEIDWVDDAYALDVVEEEKMVVVRTFSKVKGDE